MEFGLMGKIFGYGASLASLLWGVPGCGNEPYRDYNNVPVENVDNNDDFEVVDEPPRGDPYIDIAHGCRIHGILDDRWVIGPPDGRYCVGLVGDNDNTEFTGQFTDNTPYNGQGKDIRIYIMPLEEELEIDVRIFNNVVGTTGFEWSPVKIEPGVEFFDVYMPNSITRFDQIWVDIGLDVGERLSIDAIESLYNK